MNHVLVFGDIMLDQYCVGEVERISPEAPIPIVKVKKRFDRLGGAANVANNLIKLENQVTLVGIVGRDSCGERLLELLQKEGIENTDLLQSKKNKTISKIRVIGNQQQIVRLDDNDHVNVAQSETIYLENVLRQKIVEANIVVISDYNKGTCEAKLIKTIIELCSDMRKMCIVDPKGYEWSKYTGATLVTPNLKELSDYLGETVSNEDVDIEIHCFNLCLKLGIESLLITRSEKGMTLIDKNNNVRHFNSMSKEVFDVSGAGDTAIATLASFIGQFGIEYAIEIANIAAGIVVGKIGTSVVYRSEIDNVIKDSQENRILKKIVNIKELILMVNSWKCKNEKVVFTNGCYDIFHKGHVFSIFSASEFGEHLIVAVNSDESVKRNKGPKRPINTQFDRAYVIAALECVDAVIIFEEETPEKILSILKPDILVKGADYKFEDIKGREYVKQVKVVQYLEGYSTSKIIENSEKS